MGWGKLPSREFSSRRVVREQESMVAIVREFFSRVIFLGSNCTGGKAIFLGSNIPGVGQISSGATFFVSNHPGGNHSGDLSEGELLVGVTFLGDNLPGDDQGANCLGTTSPRGNDPETVINTVGQKIFFVI